MDFIVIDLLVLQTKKMNKMCQGKEHTLIDKKCLRWLKLSNTLDKGDLLKATGLEKKKPCLVIGDK